MTDKGAGIDPAFLPHVFNRFSQEDTSTTRPTGGLGLGLAIVRHLVEQHHGTVEALSAGVGKGATFSVTLPLAKVRQPPVDDEGSVTPAPVRDGKGVQNHRPMKDFPILVVNDDLRDARGRGRAAQGDGGPGCGWPHRPRRR